MNQVFGELEELTVLEVRVKGKLVIKLAIEQANNFPRFFSYANINRARSVKRTVIRYA